MEVCHNKSNWISHVYVVRHLTTLDYSWGICIIVKRPELSYVRYYVYAFLQNAIVTTVEAMKFLLEAALISRWKSLVYYTLLKEHACVPNLCFVCAAV